MSYILNALKKSQQQRQQERAPTIHSLQQQLPPLSAPASPLNSLVIGILAVLLLSLMGSYAWLFYQTTADGKSPLSDTVTTASPEQTVEPVAVPAPSTEPVATVEPAAAASAAEPAAAKTVINLWELPAALQRRVPGMTFSFHVYSDNPLRRTIIINGRRLKEGGMVNDEIALREITASGVVLHLEQHYFYVPVVENW